MLSLKIFLSSEKRVPGVQREFNQQVLIIFAIFLYSEIINVLYLPDHSIKYLNYLTIMKTKRINQ